MVYCKNFDSFDFFFFTSLNCLKMFVIIFSFAGICWQKQVIHCLLLLLELSSTSKSDIQ